MTSRSAWCKVLGSLPSLVKRKQRAKPGRARSAGDRSDLMVSRIKGTLIPLVRRVRWAGKGPILFEQRCLDIRDSPSELMTDLARGYLCPSRLWSKTRYPYRSGTRIGIFAPESPVLSLIHISASEIYLNPVDYLVIVLGIV